MPKQKYQIGEKVDVFDTVDCDEFKAIIEDWDEITNEYKVTTVASLPENTYTQWVPDFYITKKES